MKEKIYENNVNEELNKANSLEGFYADTAILVTGATGFVGKAILEKLLRVCSRVAAIFILLRRKKNQTIEQRLEKLIDDPIYDNVREKDPSILSKIHPVQGDVSLPDLGLSPKDRITLTENVNIVLKFNEPLDLAVNINTAGTARIIQLCEELKRVVSVVYVSTAFSNAHLPEIEEKVYTTYVEPSIVIDICEAGDKISIDQLEEEILKTYPNTYTFTKNLAEQIVSNSSDRLSVAIVRPSIIGASLEEPCPGWLGNAYGVTGIFLPISMGIVKVFPVKKGLNVDIIPIDLVVDAIICAAWHVTLRPNNKVIVYNCTSNACPLRWDQMIDILVQCIRETPMNSVLLYPSCLVVDGYVFHVLKILLSMFPAFVVDTFLKLSSRKPVMMEGNKRFNKLIAQSQYFITHEWTFHRDNISKMMVDAETLKDSKIVKLNRSVDWKKYIASYTEEIEKFILKKKPKSVDARRQRLSVLYCTHQVTQVFGIIIFLAIILYVVY